MNGIILLGAPGSGKGTTAEQIRDKLSLIHLSTGDMLRDAVKQETEVGKEAGAYMKRGDLVPDAVIIKLVENRLDAGQASDAYLFDGFPRTVPQAELLDQSLADRGGKITHVFLLEAPREVLITRLTGRRICRQCGTNYHVVNVPPAVEGVCDSCGGELYQRPDDNRETIENRLDIFAKQTGSLVARYEEKGILHAVDSDQGAEGLASEVGAIIESEKA